MTSVSSKSSKSEHDAVSLNGLNSLFYTLIENKSTGETLSECQWNRLFDDLELLDFNMVWFVVGIKDKYIKLYQEKSKFVVEIIQPCGDEIKVTSHDIGKGEFALGKNDGWLHWVDSKKQVVLFNPISNELGSWIYVTSEEVIQMNKLKLAKRVIYTFFELNTKIAEIQIYKALKQSVEAPKKKESMLESVANSIMNLTGADNVGLYQIDMQRQRAYIFVDLEHPKRKGFKVSNEEGIIGFLWREGREEYLDNNFQANDLRSKVEYFKDVKSIIFISIKRNNLIIGYCYIEGHRVNQFDQNAIYILKKYAEIFATLIPDVTGLNWELSQELIDLSPSAIIVEQWGKVKAYNQKAKELVGNSSELELDKDIGNIYLDRNDAREIKDNIIDRKKIERRTSFLKHPDGQPVHIYLSAKLLSDGSTVGYFEDAREIDEHHALSQVALETLSLMTSQESLLEGLKKFVEQFTNIHRDHYLYLLLWDEMKGEYTIECFTGNASLLEGMGIGFAGIGLPLKYQGSSVNHKNIFDIKSCSSFLLNYKKRTEAILILASEGSVAFEAMDLLSVAHSQLAFVSHHARRERSQEAKLSFLKYLRSETFSINPESDQVLKNLVEFLSGEESVAWASLRLMDNYNKIYKWIISSKRPEGLIDPSKIMRPKGLTAQIMQTGESKIIPNIAEPGSGANQGLLTLGVSAVIGFPFEVNGETIGVIWLHYDHVRNFSEFEIETFEAFINQAATVYENSVNQENQKKLIQAYSSLPQRTATANEHQMFISEQIEFLLNIKKVVMGTYNAEKSHFEKIHGVANVPKSFYKDIKKTEKRVNSEHLQFDFVIKKEYTGILIQIDAQQYLWFYISAYIFLPGQKEVLRSFLKYAQAQLMARVEFENLYERTELSKKIFSLSQISESKHLLKNFCLEINKLTGCDFVLMIDAPFKGVGDSVAYINEDVFLSNINAKDILEKAQWYKKPHWALSRAMLKLVKEVNFNIKSGFVFPLIVDDVFFGALICGYSYHHFFSEIEKLNITLFATIASSSLKNHYLVQKINQQAILTKNIFQTGQFGLKTKSMTEYFPDLAVTLGQTIEHLVKGKMIVMVWRREGFQIRMEHSYPEDKYDDFNPKILPLNVDPETEKIGIVIRCALLKKKEYAPDVRKHSSYITGQGYIRSQLSMPILVENDLIGIINIESDQLDAFPQDVQLTLELFAQQASMVFQGVKRGEELTRLKKNIQQHSSLDWLSTVCATWGHDLKREIGHIRNNLIRFEGIPSLPEKAIHQSQEIYDSLDKVLDIPMTAPLSPVGETESFDLVKLLEKDLEARWRYQKYQDIKKSCDFPRQPCSIKANPNWIRKLLEIIVENAVRSLRHSLVESKMIEFHLTRLETELQLMIGDNGNGFPEALLQKVCKAKISKEDGGIGLGIGLLIAASIVGTYGGQIHVANHPEHHGAAITIRLPLAKSEDYHEA